MAEWFFKPLQEGGKISEPIHGEFFSADAVSDPGTALIREGIQNSLDQSKGGSPVIVRVYLSGNRKRVSRVDADNYFKGAWGHYKAKENGIHPGELPDKDAPCDFIVFEDYSTTGLEGDPNQAFKPKEGGKNNFYHFFRAEGQTDKDEIELGSWGVGKYVFYRSSRISTVFGLTVRASDKKKMLMGKTILKSHYLGDDYCQDGYFGIPPSGEQKLVMPTSDSDILNNFSKTFNLQRSDNDPGLSLVVPWPDPEISEKEIISAVLRDYFYPIIIGQLEVLVETPNIEVWLNSETILEELAKLDSEITKKLKPLVKLADWALQVDEEERFLISEPDSDYAWKWSKSLFSEEQLEKLKESYFSGAKVAVRIPVKVRKKNGEKLDTYFDVFLVRDNKEELGRPTFIREGIIISKVDAPRTRGVRAIVIAHHKHISKFLRKAENPSHTEWHHYHLKEDYDRGYVTDLDFVKRSVHELVRIISETEKEEDPTLLVDYFSLPKGIVEEEPVETEEPENGEEDGDETIPPEPPQPPPRPRKFRIQKNDGGFSILPGENETPPDKLKVKVAYDTRRGNPLKKYNKADFEIDKDPIQLKPDLSGVEVIELKRNTAIIKILDSDFGFHMKGFDKLRQLYVKVDTFKGDVDGNS